MTPMTTTLPRVIPPAFDACPAGITADRTTGTPDHSVPTYGKTEVVSGGGHIGAGWFRGGQYIPGICTDRFPTLIGAGEPSPQVNSMRQEYHPALGETSRYQY